MERTRRSVLLAAAAAAVAPAWGQPAPLLRKKIPSSAEEIPAIGLGTARRYERPGPGLAQALERFAVLGATVIDTAFVYGEAEVVRPEYVEDNLGAARGRLPDAATRRRMASFIDAI